MTNRAERNAALRRIILVGVLGGCAGCAARERGVELESLAPREISGWRASGPDQSYDRRTIFDYIDGAGEVYLQYAFQSVLVREFTRPGHSGLTVQVFDMGRPEDAFGIFSLEREDRDAGIGQDSEYGGGLLRFWKGRFFATVSTERDTPESRAAVLALGQSIAAAIQAAGRRPVILEGLPAEGLLQEKVRYFPGILGLAQHYPLAGGNLLSLGADTETVLASYRLEAATVRLVVVRYPNVAKAADALGAFSKGYDPPLGADGAIRTASGRWAGARRVGRVVAAAFEAADREQIDRLLTRTARRMEDQAWAR